MAAATLTSKGQITIPIEIRERMGLRQGDRLRFEVDGEGNLRLEFETDVRRDPLIGRLAHLAKPQPVSVEEMHDAVALRFRSLDGKAAR
jgi:AbrB family looped-hinge helix DNA binding protein